MRITAVYSKLKQTISISSEFWLLQMVSELDGGHCASEDVGPQGSGL